MSAGQLFCPVKLSEEVRSLVNPDFTFSQQVYITVASSEHIMTEADLDERVPVFMHSIELD